MMTWWMVAAGTLLAALSFGAGSYTSARTLDLIWDEAWEACAAKIRRGQLEKLRAGLVLALTRDGQSARWTAVPEHPAARLASIAVRDMAQAPNESHMPSDRQVRAELAALANENVPPPGHGAQRDAATGPCSPHETAGPGHSLPLAEWGALMLRDLADLAVWRERAFISLEEERLADAAGADRYIAWWAAESSAALAGASWHGRLLDGAR